MTSLNLARFALLLFIVVLALYARDANLRTCEKLQQQGHNCSYQDRHMGHLK